MMSISATWVQAQSATPMFKYQIFIFLDYEV